MFESIPKIIILIRSVKLFMFSYAELSKYCTHAKIPIFTFARKVRAHSYLKIQSETDYFMTSGLPGNRFLHIIKY